MIPEQIQLHRNARRSVWTIIMVLLLSSIVAFFFYQPDKNPNRQTVKQHDQLMRSAYWMSSQYFRNRLVNPASFNAPDQVDSIEGTDSLHTLWSHFDALDSSNKKVFYDYQIRLAYIGGNERDTANWIIQEAILNGVRLK